MSFNILGKAVEQAKAAAAAAKAEHAKQQAAADAADAAAKYKAMEETIEDALEHAGISGVDVQIDANGFARVVGDVASEAQQQTASTIIEQFAVTGLDVQLKVVAPEGDDSDESSIWAGAAAPASVTYKTKKGDSWWGIAQKFYGDGTRWKKLKRANGWPRMLHPNVDLTIPNKDELEKFAEE